MGRDTGFVPVDFLYADMAVLPDTGDPFAGDPRDGDDADFGTVLYWLRSIRKYRQFFSDCGDRGGGFGYPAGCGWTGMADLLCDTIHTENQDIKIIL